MTIPDKRIADLRDRLRIKIREMRMVREESASATILINLNGKLAFVGRVFGPEDEAAIKAAQQLLIAAISKEINELECLIAAMENGG